MAGVSTGETGSCLVVGDGQAERRQLPLLAVPHALALPLSVHARVLVLALVVPHHLFVLAVAPAPASSPQVLGGLQVVLEHRALVVPLQAGTVHLVFTDGGRDEQKNVVRKPISAKLAHFRAATIVF